MPAMGSSSTRSSFVGEDTTRCPRGGRAASRGPPDGPDSPMLVDWRSRENGARRGGFARGSGETIMRGGLTRWVLILLAVCCPVWLLRSVFEEASLPRADLVIGNGAEPQSLDPDAATAIPERRVLNCLFEGLVVPDQRTLEPTPGMARAWKRYADGRGWTFHLRPGLR